MNRKPLAKHVDGILEPLGFSKKGLTWNRLRNGLTEVIDIQFSSSGTSLTLNAGVLHPEIYSVCWDEPPPEFVEEPSCTVRARIGRLVNGKDFWWDSDQEELDQHIVAAIREFIMPFLERMTDLTSMEAFLEDRSSKRKYPPEIIYLAALKHKLGDTDGAYALLLNRKRLPGSAWEAKMDSVAEFLKTKRELQQ